MIGIWILGDQLNINQSALYSCQSQKADTPVILIESEDYVQQRPYHQQKLVLIWSAMRHFAEELKQDGLQVSYKVSEDFLNPLKDWVAENHITELRIMMPSDRSFYKFIQSLELSCKINWIPNNHFIWSTEEFQAWSEGRKRLILEDFYREGRKRYNILMENDQPIGNQWNFDKENRKPPKKGLKSPPVLKFEPDQITKDVIKKVKSLKTKTYGNLDLFNWGITREQAVQVLEHFIEYSLPNFGTYQDAMVTGEDFLYHSLISPYLNIGLLQPMEVIQAIETAYYEQDLPLNSVEGFIRQVLGWREYMYGLYHFVDEAYFQNNWFNHSYQLPSFYWNSSETEMNCLKQVLSQVERTGYAHHIQRLMVLNNFALIVGVLPQEVENWFHAAFIDAYDWVMQTNVLGMGQFADGGLLASKPYAASANYINKMSDYCKGCCYNPKAKTGENACPFNFFYWDFLIRHQDQLKSQGRMNLVLSHLKKMDNSDREVIQTQAAQWRKHYNIDV
ncbi:MAG: cryptochrome/photolyase family protein [Microcystaceae cyanobacterium]